MENQSLEELIKKTESRSKVRVILFTTIPIVAGVILVLVSARVFFSSQSEIENDVIEREQFILDSIAHVDSLNSTMEVIIGGNSKIDSVANLTKKRTEIISKYYTHDRNMEGDSITRMMADTLTRYFTWTTPSKLSKKYIRNSMRYAWKKYPKQETRNIEIKFCDEDESVVLSTFEYSLNGKKFTPYWTRFVFNEKNEITYIRSFEVEIDCDHAL